MVHLGSCDQQGHNMDWYLEDASGKDEFPDQSHFIRFQVPGNLPTLQLHLSNPEAHPRCLKGSTEAGLNTDGNLARSSANKPKYWSHTGWKQILLAQIRDSGSSSSTAMSLKREDTPIIGRLLAVTADLGTTTITATPLRPDIVFKSSFCLGTHRCHFCSVTCLLLNDEPWT